MDRGTPEKFWPRSFVRYPKVRGLTGDLIVVTLAQACMSRCLEAVPLHGRIDVAQPDLWGLK